MGRGVCSDERAIQRQSSGLVALSGLSRVVRSLNQTTQRNQTGQILATRREMVPDTCIFSSRSRYVLPQGQRTVDIMSNAGRFGVALFEAYSLENAYQTVIGKPIRPVE